MTACRKLIFHVGLPKTGTSALQRWCVSHRDQLGAGGIIYPDCGKQERDLPRHQFLVSGLMANDMTRLRAILSNAGPGRVFLFSAEGMTNHFYDFRPEAFERFRDAVSGFDVTIFLVARRVDAWVTSYYKQAVINPPMPAYHYATPLTLAEFERLPRVRRLMDIATLKKDLATAYGANRVEIAHYEQDWKGRFFARAGLAPPPDLHALPAENISLSDDLVELVRQLNALNLPADTRAAWLASIRDCFRAANHNVLRLFYGRPEKPEKTNRRVTDVMDLSLIECLIPRNKIQAQLIESLKTYLAGQPYP